MDQQKINEFVGEQFGAALAMLRNAIAQFPSEEWNDDQPFWYNAYHCLFFTDYYLNQNPVEFQPPFGFGEFDEVLPEPRPSRTQLLEYADRLQEKIVARVADATAEDATDLWQNQSRTRSFPAFELHIYNMRHVQHHAAQVNLLLRQAGIKPAGWVSRRSGREKY